MLNKMDAISRSLILIGVLFIFGGLFWYWSGGKIPLGKLPGDIHIETQNSKIYIPITTSLILSGVLSLLAWLFRKL